MRLVRDSIELVDADASWAAQYRSEADALLSVVRAVRGLRLEHFDSKAVPGLRAKPIIDILLVHPEPALWPEFVEPVNSLGYVYWAENPREDRMFFERW